MIICSHVNIRAFQHRLPAPDGVPKSIYFAWGCQLPQCCQTAHMLSVSKTLDHGISTIFDKLPLMISSFGYGKTKHDQSGIGLGEMHVDDGRSFIPGVSAMDVLLIRHLKWRRRYISSVMTYNDHAACSCKLTKISIVAKSACQIRGNSLRITFI